MEQIILKALSEDTGKRLDLYISQNTDYSRNSVQILLDNGDISVNDKAVTKSYKIKDGDVVRITVHPPKEKRGAGGVWHDPCDSGGLCPHGGVHQ